MASARLVVLALFVVGCQSWRLPVIPAGRRAQFYTQQSDGAYKYGYDTAEGLFQVQEADPANEVRGKFGADGGKIEYTAGVDGFVVISHTKATSGGAAAQTYKAPVRFATLEELNTLPKPVVDTPEVAEAKAQFKAAYEAAAAAAEAAPDVNIITGAVPVVVPAVQNSYLAPADDLRYSGPLATLDASGNVEETAEVKAAKAQFKAAYDAAAAAAAAAPDVNIITGAAPFVAPVQIKVAGPVPIVKSVRPVEVAHVRSSTSDDGSYQFSYETSDSSRSESADAANSVEGNFEFVADDAQRRRVDYKAGAETGFVAIGDHLPVSVSDTAEVAAAKASFKNAYESAAAAAEAAEDDSILYSVPAIAAAPPATYLAPVQPVVTTTYTGAKTDEIADFRSTSNADGSYQFSYETSDSSRSESADAANNVEGNFDFVADDAQRRRVDYKAGAEIGFVAIGDHLPVSVSDTAEVAAAKASFKNAYESAAAAAEAAEDDSILYSVPAVAAAPPAAYLAPVQPVVTTTYTGAKTDEIANFRSTSNADGSYQFSYETSDSSRSESADAANNVEGNFEFVADDAQRRRVDYKAGAEIGFVAIGDHLPVSVSDTAEVAAAKASFKNAYESAAAAAEAAEDDSILYSVPAVAAAPPAAYLAPVQPVVTTTYTGAKTDEIANFRSTSNADGSYQFSYETSDSSRSESADAANNVEGNFEFVADDTQRRRVDYKAGAEIGFVAIGDHLPVSVSDTAEVAAAKASFKNAYESAAAAAEATPDNSQEYPIAPVYSVPAPAPVAAAQPVAFVRVATLEELNTLPKPVVDTPEVAKAKAQFKAAYEAAAAAAEAAPDTGIITAPVTVVKTQTYPSGYSQLAKAAHHGNVLTYSFDGITVMQADGESSPAKFGYTYE